MAVTLNDYYKQAIKGKDYISAKIIKDLIRESRVMDLLSFKSLSGLKTRGTRWQTLPRCAAFRKISAGYTPSTGRTEEIEETVALLGGDIDVDRVFEKVTDVLEDPVVTQMSMKAESVARVFNDTFINGDLAVDPDAFEGLKKRVSNMPSRMTIDIATSTANLPVLASGNANIQIFLDAIHKAQKYVKGATHIFCNETTYLGLGQCARRINLYQQITDALGRTWETIGGLPFHDIGLKTDLTTEIITNTEDPGDGGNDSTSLYVVRIGGNGGLNGIQLNGTSPMAYDPLTGGEKESAPVKLRRIDWGVGLANLSNFCIARVKGFSMTA